MVRKILFGPNLISHWFLRWGHLVCHVHPWLRQLCRTIETLPPEIQRSYEGLFDKGTNHNMSFAFRLFSGWEANGGGAFQPWRRSYGWTAASGLASPHTNSHLPIIDHLCWQPSWFDTKPVCFWFDLVIYFVHFRPWLPVRVMSCSPIAMASSSNYRIVISSSIKRREEQHWWQQLYTNNTKFTAEKRAPDLNSCALKWTKQKTGGASTKKLAFLLFSFQHHVSSGHSTNHVLYPHVLEVMLYSCIVCHWNCSFPKVFSSM